MSYRSRLQLLSPHGVQNLSVPLVGGRDQKGRLTTEVEIDYSGKWLVEQWRSLESWYNRSPFFFHYGPSVMGLFNEKPKYLFDLAMASQRWTLRQLGWKGEISSTASWEPTYSPESKVKDCRNSFLPRNRQTFQLQPYQQVFGHHFESNLSMLDLLFNLGPQAGAYLLNQH